MKTIFLIAILLISSVTFETNAQEDIKGDTVKEGKKASWWENPVYQGNLLRDVVPEELQLLAAKCNRKIESCSQNFPLYSLKDKGEIMFAKGKGFFKMVKLLN
jgi:hypothetical protein